ncbi:MAG: outer membrane beta-barrel protein [Candidatus Aminicenantes bacterium]|nr:MAG: outer membrane beta-barrel protein [Candidatus Aminicenantes bacterium]
MAHFLQLKKAVKLKSFIFAALVVFFPLISSASPKKEIILGFGLGYSGSFDATLQEWIYDYTEHNEMYFKERGKVKNNLSIYAQYFFSPRIGLELEFRQQKGSYFSHLEWFGRWIDDPLGGEIYIPINHIEEPYRKDWTVSSLTLCFVYAYRQYSGQKLYPYLSVGFGFHFLNADQELVRNRWKLGPEKSGESMKLGVGLRYRFSSKLAVNFKVFGESLLRGWYSQGTTYVGHDQFDFYFYMETNEVIRSRHRNLTARSFTHGGINLSLEFRL